jgi:hypothetical protein
MPTFSDIPPFTDTQSQRECQPLPIWRSILALAASQSRLHQDHVSFRVEIHFACYSTAVITGFTHGIGIAFERLLRKLALKYCTHFQCSNFVSIFSERPAE